MYNLTNPAGANNHLFVSCVCAHVCFHQNPFASAVSLADKLVAHFLQQYPPNQSPLKTGSPRLEPSSPSESALSSPLAYQALWELCPPPANKVTRRHADERGGTAQDGSLGNLLWVLLSFSEAMMGTSVCVRASCEAARNVWWGMEGACLSLCLHVINHYT